MKILFVDDDLVLHRVLGHRLKREGYEVGSAYNGREALESAREHPPQLIILDAMMAELDGYGVLQELKSDPTLKTIPVIFLTAKTREQDLVDALELGASDYLTKPFSPNELIARIRRHIQAPPNS